MAVAGSITYQTKLDTSGFQKGVNEIEGKTKTGGASVKNIIAGLGITKVISTAMNTIKNSMDGAISRLDTMNNFPKVMSNLGISAKESQSAINKLSEGLQGIPTSLDAGALAVQRFTSKNNDVQKSVDIFLAVNDAILAGGASTEIQASALEQLSQSYAKGKMDMMEWRSIQTAMPAQLKQVASAMGLTTDELGEMLRTGENTEEVFDDFINTIIKMDKTGVKGFKSLKEQARNATGGIQTSITNMKTAITRGVAGMIQEFDKVLKKKGFGSISENITKLGKQAENLLKNIGRWMPNVIDVLGKAINILIKFAPAIIGITTAVTGYKVAMGLATTATNLFTAAMSLNPIGVAVAGFVALTASLVAYTQQASGVDAKTKEINNSLKEYHATMDNINEQKEKTLSASMQEIYHYQSLYQELQNLVDENGKVKEGYEDRVGVITGQLSEALGTEITMTDGVIDNYQELKNEINQTIEYKKALAYFNAHEAEYNEAVAEETTLRKNYNKALENSNQKQEDYNKKLEFYAKHLGVSAEELDKVAKGQLDVKDSSKEMQRAFNDNALWDNAMLGLNDYQKKLDDANNVLKETGKTYADNQNIIYDYNLAQQYLADGNYDAMYRVYNDTVTFNGKTKQANEEKYETEKANLEAYRQYLLDNQKKYGEDFVKSETDRIDQELQMLEQEKVESNKKIEEKNAQARQITLTGVNDQLKVLKDHQYEFKETSNGNMQLYVDGIKQGKPVSVATMADLVNGTIAQINAKRGDATTAGRYLTDGVAVGIESGRWGVLSKVSSLTADIMARFQRGFDEHSPSKLTKQYGKWLDEGLQIGIEEESDKVLNSVDNLSDDIVDRMKNAVNIQTGKMAFSGTSGSICQMLSSNASFTGDINVKAEVQEGVLFEANKRINARKNLQTQFGGAYSVSN